MDHKIGRRARMQRPALLRVTPVGLRTRLYFHLYRSRRAQFSALYESAPLHYAPGMRMRLMPSDEGHSCIALTGVYEPVLTRQLVRTAQKGGVLVDVGANYGYYSLLWAAQRSDNRVMAFEASPRNHQQLLHNLDTNGVASQVEVHQLAMGQAQGQLQFDLGPAEQSGWGGFASSASAHHVSVDVMRLDQVWQREQDIAALKIDVEGADTWVLRGAEGLLRQRRVGVIYFEQNKPRMEALGIAPSEAVEFLRDVGYEARPMSNPKLDLVEYSAVARAGAR